jgi:hypothetical protein
MNPLTNLVLSVGETVVHETGRLLFGLALGRAKELLGTPQPLAGCGKSAFCSKTEGVHKALLSSEV